MSDGSEKRQIPIVTTAFYELSDLVAQCPDPELALNTIVGSTVLLAPFKYNEMHGIKSYPDVNNAYRLGISKIMRDNLVNAMDDVKDTGDALGIAYCLQEKCPKEVAAVKVSRRDAKSNMYVACKKVCALVARSAQDDDVVFQRGFEILQPLLQQRLFSKMCRLTKDVTIAPKQKDHYLKMEYGIIYGCIKDMYRKLLWLY